MKYKNKLKITRSLSFLLVVFMLLVQIPFSAVALEENEVVTPPVAENVSAPPTSDDVTLESEGELFEFETAGVVREVTEWREESVKHFTLPNGTYQAVTYADAVHRKDSAGVWQDIDNSLNLQNVRGAQQFATSDLRTTFAKSFAPNSALFTLDENGYTVSMSYLSVGLSASTSKAATATVTNAPLRTKTEWETVEEAAAINNTSSIVYADIKENTDLEYVLQGNDIKENIIVKAPAGSYAYQFELSLTGLVAKAQDDGRIDLCDATTGETKYSIPAPYMVDANGERSNAVAYTLTSTSKGVYRLTVTANAAWINAKERAFPVKIDPSINYDTGIIDTHISSQQPNASFGDYEDLVIAPNYDSYAYIKIDLPTLPAGADVISANLHTDYYFEGTLGSWVMLGSYKVSSAWTESMTWNTHLAGEGTIIDTSDYVELVNVTNFSGMSDYYNGTALWNITNVLEGWYQNPATNHGMAFHYEYDDPYTVYIKSSEAAFGCPYMTVQYSYLADGVYAIYSTAYQNRWMTVANDSTTAGANLQQIYGTTSPLVNDLDYSSLFIISYCESSDGYIIRSLLNKQMGLGYSDDLATVITKELPRLDSDVAANDTFKIEWDATKGGFKLCKYNSSYVISIASTSTANLSLVQKNYAAAPAFWQFAPYTGSLDLVTPTPVEEGIYFIKSAEIEFVNDTVTPYYVQYYMQVDDNDSQNNYSTDGADIEGWNFFGGNYQKWEILYVGNGYYVIKSVRSGQCLTITTDNLNQSTNVIQMPRTYTSNQLWRISETADGSYVFRPKLTEAQSSDWCMGIAGDYYGCKVKKITYANDANKMDEWILHKQKDYTLMYIGDDVGDETMPGAMTMARHHLNYAGLDGYGYTEMSKEDALEHLCSTSIFSCYTHGSQTGITTAYASPVDPTNIIKYSLDIATVNALDDTAFDDLKLVLFGACKTGMGGDDATNLVNTMYAKGADVVIGFMDEVINKEIINWTEAFFASLSNGDTVGEAMEIADDYVESISNLKDLDTTIQIKRYVLGSTDMVIC